MENNTIEIDNNSRVKIVNEIDKNFFVVANAGSGKTSILVNRMVSMVEAGIDISKICAITFTKAAAVEFLNRFQIVLRERENASDDHQAEYEGDLGPSSKEKRLNCKKALKNINQCFLGTIDSFCNQILSEYPLDAKIPSSSTVISEEDEKAAYLAEYARISREYASPLYDSFKAFNALNKNAQNVFTTSISDVIRATSLNLVFDYPNKSINDVLIDLKNKYEQDIKDDIEELLRCKGLEVTEVSASQDYGENYKNFTRFASNLKKPWTLENFVETISNIKKNIKELRFIDNPNTKIILFSFMKKSKIYKYDSEGNPFNDLCNLIDNIKYQYSLDFLLKVEMQVRRKLKEEGKLTFDEYLLTFREMLLNDMENGMNIIRHIRGKHAYFLIDESQDTSPFQTELFLYLTSSVKALRKEDCKPIPGSLFILGDPKQSIYRFRGADVPSYLNTKYLFENVFDKNNNEVLLMTKNFRSTLSLINYFNDVFKNMDNYYQIPEKANVEGTSGLYITDNYIDVIRKMHKNPKYEVHVKGGDAKFRAPEYKDFMIITKSKSNHDRIIKELKDNNIPCYVEGSFNIKDTDIVKSVYAIFNYVVNKDNLINSGALYDLLVSPIFKLKYENIIGITKDNIPDDIKDYFNVIDSLCNINNPVILFDNILNNIELFKYVDYSNMEYAYFIFEALKDSYNNSIISSLDDALIFITDFIKNKQERVMSMDFNPNAVKLANLHKVKGLEAPIVILAKSSKGNVTPTICMDYINNKSYIIQTAQSTSKSGNVLYDIKTSIFDNEKEIEKQEQSKEDERLKYVAATRARSYLFIENSAPRSYWASLVTEGFAKFDISDNNDNLVEEINVNDICNHIDVTFNNESTYNILSPSKLELQRINNKYSDIENENNYNLDARLKGTIIHRLMELIVSSNFILDKDTLINNIKSEFNIDNNEYINLLINVYDNMINGGYNQSNGHDKDLFNILKKSKCYCELPFSYSDNDNIWYGNIDLLYVYNNKWYIVDYKTNYESDNLDKEYENQLNAYKEALKKNKNIDAEAYIYHIG